MECVSVDNNLVLGSPGFVVNTLEMIRPGLVRVHAPGVQHNRTCWKFAMSETNYIMVEGSYHILKVCSIMLSFNRANCTRFNENSRICVRKHVLVNKRRRILCAQKEEEFQRSIHSKDSVSWCNLCLSRLKCSTVIIAFYF